MQDAEIIVRGRILWTDPSYNTDPSLRLGAAFNLNVPSIVSPYSCCIDLGDILEWTADAPARCEEWGYHSGCTGR